MPRALRALGFNTTHVGSTDPGVPPRGSDDAVVVEFTQRTNQVIVTSNHDMILICADAGQRFVWLDPRGKKLHATDQVLLVLSQIQLWERLLEEHSQHCVHALRTRAELLEPSEAARLAYRRMRDLERRKRRAHRPDPPGPLFEDEL